MSVGWLSCTWVGHFDTPEEFVIWAVPFLGEFALRPGRWRSYDVVMEAEGAVRAGVRERSDGLELHLDVPATVLESLPLPTLERFLSEVVRTARNIPRLDVALDDWEKRQRPEQLDALTADPADPAKLSKRWLKTRAQDSDFRRSRGGKRAGASWYLGAPMGEARLRVYDKAAESQGRIDAIRWELQLRDQRAKDALCHLIWGGPNLGSQFGQLGTWAAAELLRFVDFVDREADTNISRCPRLDWWAALVGGASAARPVYVPPEQTVERLHRYALRALPSLLATLADSSEHVLGVAPELYIRSMLDRGRARPSVAHLRALRSVERNAAD